MPFQSSPPLIIVDRKTTIRESFNSIRYCTNQFLIVINDQRLVALFQPPHRPPSTTSTPINMPQGYSSRDVGDPSQIKKNKQSMADLKLRRLTELNNRLREDLERERIPVSQAAKSIIQYTSQTKDFMVPSIWGTVDKKDDPYAPQQSGGCCLVM
ncbi:hypothetical protein sscle_06g053750 [Sclerotinia sclerotiorum 1980 UF-70]|uniref:Guanine nucleotide-binding protein subunit gamma n=1 Tax=Sclerotinia sclerotiorum (strain ATCC 18683 / 1980 / Ss-1) TaxID=665079 RepID=A0A1D9Q6P9_SCLS1|nr:hypothetical protein sscle_06g053750 [Sclerotinia sclerotiorum 1980 UF-70]